MCHESLPLGLVLNNPKPCGGTLICQQRLWGLQLERRASVRETGRHDPDQQDHTRSDKQR